MFLDHTDKDSKGRIRIDKRFIMTGRRRVSVVPEQLTDEEFNELLREQDSFKLAIRGQTAIEGEIDAAIADVFVGDVPGEIRKARFPIRLALLVGLGILPARMTGLYLQLARLRNDFAHGNVRGLTPQRARSLIHEVRALLGNSVPAEFSDAEERIAAAPPRTGLAIALRVARAIVRETAAIRRKRRDEEQRLLARGRWGGIAAALMAGMDEAVERPD